jgi:uncharacterized protein (TIRG00374 family)
MTYTGDMDVAVWRSLPPSSRRKAVVKRTVIFNLLKYVLAFGLLGFVIWQNWKPGSPTGLEHVWQRHVVDGAPVGWGFLAVAAALMTVSLLITLVRWYFLVRAQDLPFSLFDAIRIGLAGFFYNTFLPGSVGGDIVKAASLARAQSRRTVAVATVIMDRLIALWGLVWFVALFGGVYWALGWLEGPAAAVSKKIVTIAAVTVVASLGVWVLMGFLPQRRAEKFAARLTAIPKVGHSAAEFWRALWMYRIRPRCVFGVLALSWVGQVGFVFVYYFSVRTLWDPAMGPIPGVAEHFLLVPIGLVIQAVPLFPGGTGIGEAGFGGLYALFGCAAAVAVLGSLVQRIINWGLGVVAYVVSLRMKAVADTAAPPAEEPRPEGVQPAEAAAVA